jgi:hypothetical protein
VCVCVCVCVRVCVCVCVCVCVQLLTSTSQSLVTRNMVVDLVHFFQSNAVSYVDDDTGQLYRIFLDNSAAPDDWVAAPSAASSQAPTRSRPKP